MDAFIGEIRPVPYSFAPKNWAFCNGQIMSIAQNQALFSLLGTAFGGDGKTTFGLPDLRGRMPISSGQGVGLSNYNLGEEGGFEQITLNSAQIPLHSHLVQASDAKATSTSPVGNIPSNANVQVYAPESASILSSDTVGETGGTAHENRQPLTVISYIIALQGIYPSRN